MSRGVAQYAGRRCTTSVQANQINARLPINSNTQVRSGRFGSLGIVPLHMGRRVACLKKG